MQTREATGKDANLTRTIVPPPTRRRVVIEPAGGLAALKFGEVWEYRDLARTLAGRDLRLRYKQTALGVAWVVLQPLMAAAIFAFVFGRVARFAAPGGVPYFLFAFAGLAAWGAFSHTLTRSSASLVSNAHLISKVYFPRIILPLAATLSGTVDVAVALTLLFIMTAALWHFAWPALLLLPVCLVLLATLALGLGLCFSSLAVRYRDFQHVLPVFVQLLLFASPVAYGAHEVPPAARAFFYLNPLAPVLEAFRFSALGVGQVHWGYLAYSAGVAAGLLVIGAVLFDRMERDFADVI